MLNQQSSLNVLTVLQVHSQRGLSRLPPSPAVTLTAAILYELPNGLCSDKITLPQLLVLVGKGEVTEVRPLCYQGPATSRIVDLASPVSLLLQICVTRPPAACPAAHAVLGGRDDGLGRVPRVQDRAGRLWQRPRVGHMPRMSFVSRLCTFHRVHVSCLD